MAVEILEKELMAFPRPGLRESVLCVRSCVSTLSKEDETPGPVSALGVQHGMHAYVCKVKELPNWSGQAHCSLTINSKLPSPLFVWWQSAQSPVCQRQVLCG